MNSDVYGLIYCLTCSVTGKKYIGQTTQTAKARWRQHRTERRRNNTHITRALTLHGVETFTMSVIDTASDQADLDQKEILAKLRAYAQNKSPEHREAIRKSNRERVYTPEMLARISAAQKARWERVRAARNSG
jgi:predicted GIY-YIG superfamily endonuclease